MQLHRKNRNQEIKTKGKICLNSGLFSPFHVVLHSIIEGKYDIMRDNNSCNGVVNAFKLDLDLGQQEFQLF